MKNLFQHKDFNAIINYAAQESRLPEAILEKDVFVSYLLSILFEGEYKDALLFKGGTCLSKCYNLIERFSEDVDITFNPNKVGLDFPILHGLSKSAQKRKIEIFKQDFESFLTDKFYPYLVKSTKGVFSIEQDGSNFKLFYNSSTQSNSYLRPYVLLEPGALLTETYNNPQKITPLINNYISTELQKDILVNAIPISRTFWEKATILHRETFRDIIPDRYARHYYDFCKLYQSSSHNEIISDVLTLKAVLEHKDLFYRSGNFTYADIIHSGIKLLPSEEKLQLIADDYKKMSDFFLPDRRMSFGFITKILKEAEIKINNIVCK